MGRYSPIVDAYFGALDQIESIKALTDTIKSANDPPKTLEELQERVGLPSDAGYHDHHIVERSSGFDAGYSRELLDNRDNLARIPVLKHIDITAEYATKAEQPDGTFRSLRDYLADKDFETRRTAGLAVMRKYGVLK
ncbi:MAG TPA: hypothetical protein VGC86_09385 [Afipia sp.]